MHLQLADDPLIQGLQSRSCVFQKNSKRDIRQCRVGMAPSVLASGRSCVRGVYKTPGSINNWSSVVVKVGHPTGGANSLYLHKKDFMPRKSGHLARQSP